MNNEEVHIPIVLADKTDKNQRNFLEQRQNLMDTKIAQYANAADKALNDLADRLMVDLLRSELDYATLSEEEWGYNNPQSRSSSGDA